MDLRLTITQPESCLKTRKKKIWIANILHSSAKICFATRDLYEESPISLKFVLNYKLKTIKFYEKFNGEFRQLYLFK